MSSDPGIAMLRFNEKNTALANKRYVNLFH